MCQNTVSNSAEGAVGGRFSHTSTRTSIVSRILALVAVFGLVSSVNSQTLVRTFDFAAGHTGEGGGLLEANGTIFSGAQDSRIKVWNVTTGEIIRTVTGHTDWVHAFAVIDNWLFSGGRDSTVRQWTLGSFAPVRTMNAGGWVMCMAAHQRMVYAGTTGNLIIQWNPDTGVEVRRFSGHTATVRGIIHHNNLMFTASEDYTVRRWDLSLASPTPTTMGGSNWANGMEKTATRFYVSGHGGWSAGGGARVNEYALDGTFLRQMVYASWDSLTSVKVRGDVMITSAFGGLKVWSLTTATVTRDLLNLYTYNTGSGVDSFYSVSNDGCSIRRWSWADLSIMWAIPPNYGWSASASDGTSVWGGRGNGQIWQYTIATGELVRVLSEHTAGITQLLLVGNSLFSGNNDNTAKQWSATSGSLIRTFTGHTAPVTAIAVQNNNFFTGSWDQSVKVWNLNNGNLIKTISNVMNGQVYTIAVAQNLLVAGSGSYDPTVRVWDWTNSTFLFNFNVFSVSTFNTVLRETATGRVELFASDWSAVRQFDVGSRTLIRTYFAPSAICSLHVVRNSIFGGGCYYGSSLTRQWDITTGNVVRTVGMTANGVTSGAGSFSSAGSSLFLADTDGSLRQFQIPELVIPTTPTPTPTVNDWIVDPVIIPTSDTLAPETTPDVTPSDGSNS